MKIRSQIVLALLFLSAAVSAQTTTPAPVWSADKANAWYAQHKWLSGSDYIPRTAINQLEMWQANTFDPKTIDQELGWAEGIGFNTMRVFLHSLAWKQDPEGFKTRVDSFLTIAASHHIQPLFVFFDDCWNKTPKIGKQPAPKPGIHNSGWVQDPGQPASEDTTNFPELEKYVKYVMTRFAHDNRILLWDMYNEPGNSDKGIKSLPLLTAAFEWAKEVNPDQPISAGVWDWDSKKLNNFQLTHSDVITYHCYDTPDIHLSKIKFLKQYGRPVICTEYMARPRNSTFLNTMPVLKEQNVGAINWGLVEGKTNTKYAWDTPMHNGADPKVWFHEVFRKNGTPYSVAEVNLIKKLNGK